MKKRRIFEFTAIVTAFLFAGCSGSVETGPVPTITPKPTVTPVPVVTQAPEQTQEPEKADVSVTKLYKEQYENTGVLPELYTIYKDYFDIGIEVTQEDINNGKRQAVVKQQFNSISCKTDLSPANIMDYEATRAAGDLSRVSLDFSGADVILKFAKDNGIPVRGSSLITNETPSWFFTKSFSESQVTETTDEAGVITETVEYASAEVMLNRMENYIKDVIGYCNTNYPGVVVTWDVLDSPINTGDRHEKKYRTSSNWYQTIGEDYLTKALEYAGKYAATEQKLFLSQEGLNETAVLNATTDLLKVLQASGRIDGIAAQAHYNIISPNVFAIEDMFKALSATGLEVHLSEFYVSTLTNDNQDSERTYEEALEKSAKRYKNLFSLFTRSEDNEKIDIVNITFEGLTDDGSSLNEPKEYTDSETGELVVGVELPSYPYLFDEELNPKDAYFGAIGDASIKGF